MDFKDRLKELRKSVGLTQKELGEKFGLVKQTISSYENGNSTPDNELLSKIADFFDVTTDNLLGRDVTPPKKKIPKDFLKIIEQEDFVLNGRLATPEDRERLIKMYEVMYWDAKEKNKRKE